MNLRLGANVADNYFDELLELASAIVSLADMENQLDKREWKKAKAQHDALETKFKEVGSKYVDDLLAPPEGRGQAYDLVAADLTDLREKCDPSWIPAVDYVSEKLLPYLHKEAGRDPRLRKVIKALPWLLGGVALVAYFSISFFSATPINHALETKEGIQERAAAIEKLLQYDDWMDTHVRKGGWLKGILLWPIEPTEAEIKGASEFASLAHEAHRISVAQFNCSALDPGYGDKPSTGELKYLSETADYLRAPQTQWKTPAVITVVDAARSVGRCN
jgi:hypothetical protein